MQVDTSDPGSAFKDGAVQQSDDQAQEKVWERLERLPHSPSLRERERELRDLQTHRLEARSCQWQSERGRRVLWEADSLGTYNKCNSFYSLSVAIRQQTHIRPQTRPQAHLLRGTTSVMSFPPVVLRQLGVRRARSMFWTINLILAS